MNDEEIKAETKRRFWEDATPPTEDEQRLFRQGFSGNDLAPKPEPDAEYWFGRKSVSPRKAAKVLFRCNPLDKAEKTPTTTIDGTGPEDYQLLLNAFRDLKKVDRKPRTLHQWYDHAVEQKLKFPSWIDEFVPDEPNESATDSKTIGASGPVSCEEVNDGEMVAIEIPETKNWMLLIQAEAAGRWKLLRVAGANPTKNNIKDDLARWCRETGVVTDGDINPTAEYIYRHVLSKWTPPKG